MLGRSKLRVARPTDQLEEIVRFYRDGLGLGELYRFQDHNGFGGVMVGDPGGAYHLEFTRSKNHPAGKAPAAENLLVFYIPDDEAWGQAAARMMHSGYSAVSPLEPLLGRKWTDLRGSRWLSRGPSEGGLGPLN